MTTPPDNLADDPAGDGPNRPTPADGKRPGDFDLHAEFEALTRELLAKLPTEPPDSD
jgi:hypothetical protein